MGVVGHYWYAFLDRRFAGKSMPMIRRKLAAELAIGPPFAASIFLVVGALERKPLTKIFQEIKQNIHYLLLVCLHRGVFAFMMILTFVCLSIPLGRLVFLYSIAIL